MAISVRVVRPEEAQGRTRDIYDEVRGAMGLSWVPDMFQALAAHPRYLEIAWRELRPLVGRVPFERAADDVRLLAERAVVDFPPRDHKTMLLARGYGEDDLEEMRTTVQSLHSANPRLMIMATVLHDALRGQPVGTNTSPEAERTTRVPAVDGEIRVVPPDEAEARVREVYDEIRRDTAAPLVNDSYQAMARWPDYLALAWHDVRQYLATPAYRAAQLRLRNRAGTAMIDLPGPIYADAASLRHAGVQEDDLRAARGLVKLFHRLLPGLILNVAFFRGGLG